MSLRKNVKPETVSRGLGLAESQSQPDNRLRSTTKANDARGGSTQSEQTRRGAKRRKNNSVDTI
jgi:hypothetical protein